MAAPAKSKSTTTTTVSTAPVLERLGGDTGELDGGGVGGVEMGWGRLATTCGGVGVATMGCGVGVRTGSGSVRGACCGATVGSGGGGAGSERTGSTAGGGACGGGSDTGDAGPLWALLKAARSFSDISVGALSCRAMLGSSILVASSSASLIGACADPTFSAATRTSANI